MEQDSKQFSFGNYSGEFDDHINHSIRGLSDLRHDIVSISKYFVENNTNVIDIGCSQGTLIRNLRDANTQAENAMYYGIDIEEKFQVHWQDEDNLKYLIADVRSWNGMNNMSLAISMFTLQFIPERDRQQLLKKVYDNLADGGAFIFSEKVYSEYSKLQNMMDFLYYDYKRMHFSEKEILDKEQELRHMAKLTTENAIVDRITKIGFSYFQPFWRNFNFIGFLAIK